MGQALKTLSPDELPELLALLGRKIGQMIIAEQRNEEKAAKEIGAVLEKCCETHFGDTNKEWTSADFYRALCETIEDINKKLGCTQLRVPSVEKLDEAYKKHNLGGGRKLTKEEFQKVLQEVVIGTGFTGVGGAKDFLFFIFGVPAVSLFLKDRIAPARSIPNDFFLPAVTSVTVFLLAKLNKI